LKAPYARSLAYSVHSGQQFYQVSGSAFGQVDRVKCALAFYASKILKLERIEVVCLHDPWAMKLTHLISYERFNNGAQ